MKLILHINLNENSNLLDFLFSNIKVCVFFFCLCCQFLDARMWNISPSKQIKVQSDCDAATSRLFKIKPRQIFDATSQYKLPRGKLTCFLFATFPIPSIVGACNFPCFVWTTKKTREAHERGDCDVILNFDQWQVRCSSRKGARGPNDVAAPILSLLTALVTSAQQKKNERNFAFFLLWRS